MDHIIFPCTRQGGSISRLYPTCYNTKVYIGGIYAMCMVRPSPAVPLAPCCDRVLRYSSFKITDVCE